MKKIEEIAFRKGLRKINEGGINRIMSHGENGFIVISANRSEVFSSNPECDLTDEYVKYCKLNNEEPEDENVQKDWLAQRNNNADKELKDILKASKYGFTPVYGGYHGGDDVVDSFEPSYIVYNHVKGGGAGDHLNFDELRQFGIDLAKKFKQESVYIQGPDEEPNYVGQARISRLTAMMRCSIQQQDVIRTIHNDLPQTFNLRICIEAQVHLHTSIG